MTFSEDSGSASNSEKLIAAALDHVNSKSHGDPLAADYRVTLNFHPDALCSGQMVISRLVECGVYSSQFETGISAGSLSYHTGERRWNWESALFGGVYDNAKAALRPKYGALNYKSISVGAAQRFGSAHIRLKASVNDRCTFAYPDSHLNPTHFGTPTKMGLIPVADANELRLDSLDNYIEAHVHGLISINRDVDSIVLDPAYQNTTVESSARALRIQLNWHEGYCLTSEHYNECRSYRGDAVAEFIQKISVNKILTPAILGCYRDGSVDLQIVKKAWHCLARFGWQGSVQS